MLQVQTDLTAPWKTPRFPSSFTEASYYLESLLNAKQKPQIATAKLKMV